MDVHEDSPGRLRTVLSRSRKPKDDSIASYPLDTSDRLGQAGDAADSRFSRPGNQDGGNNTSEPKISKLLPGHSKRKEKRRKAQQAADEELDRGRSSSVGKVATAASLKTSQSLSTLGSQPEGDILSLMTSESEGEIESSLSRSATSAPPPMVNRPSHSEYLTSSSPNVKATTVAESPVAQPFPMMPRGVSPNRSTTLPASMNSSNISKARKTSPANGASTLSLGSADSGKSDKSRSVSPGSRIKDTFRSSKKSNDFDIGKSSPAITPEKSDRIAARRASRGMEPMPPLPSLDTFNTAHSSGHQSNKSLPSIITTPGTPPPLPTKSFDKLSTGAIPESPADDFAVGSPTRTNERPQSKDSKESFPVPSLSGSHRRGRSDSHPHAPSKLSQSMNAPATPLIEETKTPGTRNISTSSGGGFFTSMFSVAQNAATTFTSLGNNPRSRSGTNATQSTTDEKSRDPSPAPNIEPQAEPIVAEVAETAKPLAIDTIGSGELSLSHLGISMEDSAAMSGSPSTPKRDTPHNRSRSGTVIHQEDAAAREEDVSAARAVSAAYEERPMEVETPLVEDVAPIKSTGSAYEGSVGEHTPNGSVVDGDPGSLLRSSSLKNKLERTRRRKRRDGSQSTLGQSGSSMLGPVNPNIPKLTGFAVASKKRNKDFHTLFKSVPESDYLIEDYSCALQRDIILAGRIYISEGHVCFSSNILGWVTTLVISFDEVVSVEKESTAMVFPNAIAIQTLHARHTFRSLLSREATYDLLVGIWKISHPGLQSSENGTRIVNGIDPQSDKIPEGSDEDSDRSGEDGLEDEDEGSGSDDDGNGSGIVSGEGSILASEGATSPPKSAIPKKPSNVGLAASNNAASGAATGDAKATAQVNGAASASTDFPGPATHPVSQCADSATHYATLLKDDIISAPLGKIYTMVFGPASGAFMSKWLVDDQKSLELSFEDDKKGLGEDNKTRSYSYIKPLGGAIGPKQTKCITTENLDAFDLEKAVSVTVSTQTPDVPSGNVFSVKTRYCLMWAPNNSTRMIATCAIEWTGKSWLKGPIEKGANDGQVQYVNDLLKTLRAAVSKGKVAAATSGAGKSKKFKKKKSSDAEQSTASLQPDKPKASDWGLFEPIHAVLEPLSSILGPVLNVYTLVVVLSVLLAFSWMRDSGGSARSAVHHLARTSTSQRIAAYEELWRAEEAALWTWLEERVGGAEGLSVPIGAKGGKEKHNADVRREAQKERQRVLGGDVAIGGMGEKEVRRAVEITEEKLKLLKDAMGKVQGSEGKSEL